MSGDPSPVAPPAGEPAADPPVLTVLVVGEGDVPEEAARELRAMLTSGYRVVRMRWPADPAAGTEGGAEGGAEGGLEDVAGPGADLGPVALLLVHAQEPAPVITALAAGRPRPPRVLVLTDRAVHTDLADVIDADLLDGVVAVPWTEGRLAVQAVAQIARWVQSGARTSDGELSTPHDSPLLQLLTVPMDEAVEELVASVERVLGPRPRLVLPAGTRVTQEQTSVDGLLLVLRGDVALGVASPSGDEIRLHHASTGPLIGLPAMAERRKALVTARATTEVELIHLTLEQLDQALAGDPRVGAVMTAVSLRSLARRLRRAEILQLEEIRLNAILDDERAKLADALALLSEARLELVAQARSATIGDMAAGIAHELNSPLAALTRSLEHAETDIRALVAELPDGEVIERIMTTAYRRPTLSAKDERARRRELAQAGVPDHRIRALVAAGIDSAAEARRIEEAGLDDALVDAAAGLGSSMRNARLAQDHISGLVHGLRSAMRPDGLDPVPTDVADTLEDALRLTAHRMGGIEVTRRYGEVEPILAHPGQLTQVWTNLLTNAADALAGQGAVTLGVSPRPRGGARVEVADTGPGIPEELRERIFEPRFTTKSGAVRFGLGLGLGIARRIVTDHGGTIAVRSRPGETVFTIDLPARPPEETGETG